MADRAYEHLKQDANHPSLHFKKVSRFWSWGQAASGGDVEAEIALDGDSHARTLVAAPLAATAPLRPFVGTAMRERVFGRFRSEAAPWPRLLLHGQIERGAGLAPPTGIGFVERGVVPGSTELLALVVPWKECPARGRPLDPPSFGGADDTAEHIDGWHAALFCVRPRSSLAGDEDRARGDIVLKGPCDRFGLALVNTLVPQRSPSPSGRASDFDRVYAQTPRLFQRADPILVAAELRSRNELRHQHSFPSIPRRAELVHEPEFLQGIERVGVEQKASHAASDSSLGVGIPKKSST